MGTRRSSFIVAPDVDAKIVRRYMSCGSLSSHVYVHWFSFSRTNTRSLLLMMDRRLLLRSVDDVIKVEHFEMIDKISLLMLVFPFEKSHLWIWIRMTFVISFDFPESDNAADWCWCRHFYSFSLSKSSLDKRSVWKVSERAALSALWFQKLIFLVRLSGWVNNRLISRLCHRHTHAFSLSDKRWSGDMAKSDFLFSSALH